MPRRQTRPRPAWLLRRPTSLRRPSRHRARSLRLHVRNIDVATSSIVTVAATGCVIALDDPARDHVRRLVLVHREWSLQQTPPQFSFSVEPDAVVEAGITLFNARSQGGELLGIGGLKQL